MRAEHIDGCKLGNSSDSRRSHMNLVTKFCSTVKPRRELEMMRENLHNFLLFICIYFSKKLSNLISLSLVQNIPFFCNVLLANGPTVGLLCQIFFS